jgi:hypothetical protein
MANFRRGASLEWRDSCAFRAAQKMHAYVDSRRKSAISTDDAVCPNRYMSLATVLQIFVRGHRVSRRELHDLLWTKSRSL